MSTRWDELIPEPLHDAVRAAFAGAYGARAVECLGPVTGGASGAVALRMRVEGRDHLLRVEARRSPMRNPHQYACMTIAAEAGVAPPVHYIDADNGVAVMDFIETVPLPTFPGGPAALGAAHGQLAARLQGAPPFPVLGDWRAIVGRLLAMLEGRCAPGLLARHRETYEQLYAALPWDSACHVASHNDPNARNVLYDGTRLWLVDWETAYRNDPRVDVAIMADNFARTPGLADELMRAWLGRPASPEERHHIEQVRRLTRLYYAGLLIALAGAGAEPLEDLTPPTPEEFGARLARGELSEKDPATLGMIGKMCLAGLLEPLP